MYKRVVGTRGDVEYFSKEIVISSAERRAAMRKNDILRLTSDIRKFVFGEGLCLRFDSDPTAHVRRHYQLVINDIYGNESLLTEWHTGPATVPTIPVSLDAHPDYFIESAVATPPRPTERERLRFTFSTVASRNVGVGNEEISPTALNRFRGLVTFGHGTHPHASGAYYTTYNPSNSSYSSFRSDSSSSSSASNASEERHSDTPDLVLSDDENDDEMAAFQPVRQRRRFRTTQDYYHSGRWRQELPQLIGENYQHYGEDEPTPNTTRGLRHLSQQLFRRIMFYLYDNPFYYASWSSFFNRVDGATDAEIFRMLSFAVQIRSHLPFLNIIRHRRECITKHVIEQAVLADNDIVVKYLLNKCVPFPPNPEILAFCMNKEADSCKEAIYRLLTPQAREQMIAEAARLAPTFL